jgi:hypothetical protein
MKTPGKDLDKAYEQAKSYALALPQKDIPRGILTCDFLHFQYYDLEDNAKQYSFRLDELPAYIELFGYLAGYKEADPYKHWDPVNISAAEKMGQLHDRLKEIGYTGHRLELYLVRLLFCLFADDTGIFEPPNLFNRYIIERTGEDGGDLALHLQKIFETLNTPQEGRLKTIDIELNRFPYINGHLFAEPLGTADFDGAMRDTLIQCCTLEWSKISPAIFGSMFQSVMNDAERHDLGAHYTSEQNILKLIHPFFLDNLWDEFNKIKKQSKGAKKHNLILFHNTLCHLKFLDPACGCGNFLVVSYRELRLLEIELIKEILCDEKILDIELMVRVNVDQFYGIEIEEFPARIAQTALWLMDHLMNNQASAAFGIYIVRIPLTASATIVNANSLTTDWETIVPKNELSYILGNPPFLGASVMNQKQKKELENVFNYLKGCNSLDYVTCWYIKALEYIRNTNIEVSFVSTNSICQGEQVPILWPELINKHGIKLNFAHQTFKWSNEARGKAAVYCVIIGFSLNDRKEKKLYHYATVSGEAIEAKASQISPYLVDCEPIIVMKRTDPLVKVPRMVYGSKPTDGGNLIFTEEEKEIFLQKEPKAAPYIRPFTGSYEFINNIKRYCLWLVNIEPKTLRSMPFLMERVELVRQMRLNSTSQTTVNSAEKPALFFTVVQPDSNYLIIPETSSERRRYIPIGFMSKNIIANNSCSIIPNAQIYHFGIITSTMHMAWMRYVGGRLEMRYRYSASIVYNTFPWPSPTDKQKSTIEEAAQAILDTRNLFPASSLADLYDPVSMPPKLAKAHQKLDKAVEAAYGRIFDNDSQRVAYLFELYQKLCGEMFAETRKRGKGRKV